MPLLSSSLIHSAERHGLDPHGYRLDGLDGLPSPPGIRTQDPLPLMWLA